MSERLDRQPELAAKPSAVPVGIMLRAIDLDAGAIVRLVAAVRQPGAEHAVPGIHDVAAGAGETRDRAAPARHGADVDPAVGLKVLPDDHAGIVAAFVFR